jgi:predicted Fe-S protein YdhL (DUF1289 family)
MGAVISSPCIKVCTMDARAGICAGCGRTLEEIARWGTMEESERLRLMKILPARLDALNARAGA